MYITNFDLTRMIKLTRRLSEIDGISANLSNVVEQLYRFLLFDSDKTTVDGYGLPSFESVSKAIYKKKEDCHVKKGIVTKAVIDFYYETKEKLDNNFRNELRPIVKYRDDHAEIISYEGIDDRMTWMSYVVLGTRQKIGRPKSFALDVECVRDMFPYNKGIMVQYIHSFNKFEIDGINGYELNYKIFEDYSNKTRDIVICSKDALSKYDQENDKVVFDEGKVFC